MIDWTVELPKIEAAAKKFHIDPAFLQAIRHTENGRPGREFGVLSESAPTYDDQLRICCLTVSHRLVSYPLNPFTRDHESKLMYSPKWIAYFASIWAPTSNADNDPDGLNKFWYQNCLKAYLDYRDA